MSITLWNKNFILVLVGQIISLLGNAILRFAIPLYLLSETGSAALFGLVSACAFIPMIFLTPIGGIIADRINKRNIMVILDFSTAALVLLFTALLGRVNLVAIICVVLVILYGIQGTYQPTVQSSIPLLVPTDSIMQANAFINLVSSVSFLIGPVLGGALFAAFGLMPILFVSAGCFFLSAVMELFIQIPFQKRKAEGSIFQIGFRDIKQSLHFMAVENPLFLRISLLFASLNLFLSACVIIGLPVIITQTLGFEPETAGRLYGYCEGAMGAGSLLGGLCAGIFAKKMKARANSALLFFCGCTLIPIAASLTFPMPQMVAFVFIFVSVLLMMALSSLFSIQMMAYLQILTPASILGKVISCAMCIGMCASPIGQAAYGLLFEKFSKSPHILFWCAFLIVSVIALISIKPFHHLQAAVDKTAAA